MKVKEQLIQEIEKSPDFIAAKVLNFLLFLKVRIKERIAEDKKVISPGNDNSENFLDFIDKISSEIPLEEWEKIPSDLSKNLDSYLYGVPKNDFQDTRGVLAVKHEPKVIFSESVKIETSKLPRWKPHITIDRRIITGD